jgi:hypothetical protein
MMPFKPWDVILLLPTKFRAKFATISGEIVVKTRLVNNKRSGCHFRKHPGSIGSGQLAIELRR